MITTSLSLVAKSNGSQSFSAAEKLGSFAPATIAIAVAVVGMALAPSWPGQFEFCRTAIGGGEVWRLFTGHLAHWNLDHAFWDGLMFLVLGLACERRWPRRYWLCLPVSAAAISLALWWLPPQLETYRGLSGIDTALFTLVAVGYLQGAVERRDRGMALVISSLLAGLAAKIMYESAAGATLFVHSSGAFIPLPLVHLVGGIVGTTIAILADPRSFAGHWHRRD